jgi:hypothetical protein
MNAQSNFTGGDGDCYRRRYRKCSQVFTSSFLYSGNARPFITTEIPSGTGEFSVQ